MQLLDLLSWCHGDKHYTSLQEWALNDPTGQVTYEQKSNYCCKCITWIPKKVLLDQWWTLNSQWALGDLWPPPNPIIFLQTRPSFRTGQYWHDGRSPGPLRPIRACGLQTCRNKAKCIFSHFHLHVTKCIFCCTQSTVQQHSLFCLIDSLYVFSK